jgi:hypothetical protein
MTIYTHVRRVHVICAHVRAFLFLRSRRDAVFFFFSKTDIMYMAYSIVQYIRTHMQCIGKLLLLLLS